MKKRIQFRTSVKLYVLIVFVGVAFFAFSRPELSLQRASASASGPSPSHTGAPGEANCTACHSDFPVNSGSGSVSIAGLPPNYKPGQQVQITVTTAQFDAIIYGFQMTAVDSQGRQAGTFTVPGGSPPQMQILQGLVGSNTRSYIEHTVDGIIPTQGGSKSWTFTWTAPSTRVGKIGLYAAGNGADSSASPSGDYIYTASRSTLSGSAIANFDADGISDISVFRPSTGVWYSLNTTDPNFQASHFGTSGDKITPGDFDGDGKTDRAVWRPSTGVWYVEKSTGGFLIVQFGLNGDVPVQADYDGDLKTDIAVWRPSTSVWYIMRSSDGTFDIRQFGISTDKSTPGDFDADGKADVAVWRPSTGVWYIWRSTDFGYSIFPFGLNGDKPVQGDYDGDGKTDAAVYRPSDGIWYLLNSTTGFTALRFGISTDRPSPADFDGDGRTDAAIYRDGVWYVLKSSDGAAIIASFGLSGDVPIPAGYIPE